MTANASGSRHSLALVPEVSYGVIPANPAFVHIRHNSTTLQFAMATMQSAEIRSDRQIAGFRSGVHSCSGDIMSEVAQGSGFDQLLALALMNTWVPVANTGAASLSAAVGSFARSVGSFVTDGFVVNQVITSSGFATPGNNGKFKVTAVAATTLTVTPLAGQTMAVDAEAGSRTLVSSNATLVTGTQRNTVTIERNFQDVNQYVRFRGCEIDKLALSAKTGGISTIQFSVMANDADSMAQAAVAGATYDTASTNQPMNGLAAAVKEGGAPIALISDIALSLTNNMNATYVLGQANGLQPSVGKSNVTGSITAYFADATIYNKFVNETSSQLEFTLTDVAGNSYDFLLPNVRYTASPIPVQNDGPISMQIPYQALLDSTTSTNLKITRTVVN